MGSRGKGAVKQPKAKHPGGRPPVRLDRCVYDALRQPTLRAVAVLDALLSSDDERTRLLAAKALVELGSKPPAEEPAEETPKPMEVTVNYKGDYRASTG